MILVARKSDKKVLSKYEAWDLNSYPNALGDIERNGYKYISEEITMMGNMIIWVEEA